MRQLFHLGCCLLLFINGTMAQSITGDWYGTLDAMGTKLPLVLHFEGSDAQLTGSMDSPTQAAFGITMDKVSLTGNQLRFEITMMGASYKGTLSELGLSGDFSQAGFDFPLDFGRTPPAANGEKRRPQEPITFAYQREEVTFPGGNEDVVIAGELTLPTTGEIRQAVILVSGSGGQDRNSELGQNINHRPFLVLSDFLTKQGIAVLRYDDRGIFRSTGDFSTATTADLAEDAAAALRYLKSREELQDARFGIVGHSEGGIIGPMVAADHQLADFLVLLAAPGIPSDSLMIIQSQRIQQLMGVPPVVITRNLGPIKACYAFIKEHPNLNQQEMEAGLVDIIAASVDELPVPMQKAITDRQAFAKQQVAGMTGHWFRYFLSIEPKVYLERVSVPTLAMNGELDAQVPHTENLEAIAKYIGSNGNEQLTLVPLPELNHLFQTAQTGAPQEYGEIEETFSPTAMRIIAHWIQQQ
ncbi:MAG: alpha/beta hydrolase [Bacteroidota bacterium]